MFELNLKFQIRCGSRSGLAEFDSFRTLRLRTLHCCQFMSASPLIAFVYLLVVGRLQFKISNAQPHFRDALPIQYVRFLQFSCVNPISVFDLGALPSSSMSLLQSMFVMPFVFNKFILRPDLPDKESLFSRTVMDICFAF